MALWRFLSSWSKRDAPGGGDEQKLAAIQELPHRPVSPTSPSNDEFNQSPAPIDSPTTEEIKSGRPIVPVNERYDHTRRNSLGSASSQEDELASSSDSGLSEFSSYDRLESDEDNDAEAERGRSGNDGYQAVKEYTTHADHEFQAIQPNLLQFLYTKVQAWISSAEYVVPPDDRLPPCKRVRTTEIRSPSSHLEEEDRDDFELVNTSRSDGFFHLACPFYVLNSQKYQRCLLQHDLQSIEDVIGHLRRWHTQPAYCPMCYLDFDKASDRDDHIQARTCQLRDFRAIDGLNEYHKIKLGKRDRVCAGETTRWMRVWATIFPKTKPHRSPYLEGYAERTVSMTWDYWAIYGKDGVSQYLAIHGFPHKQREDKQRALAALHSFIIQELIKKVFEEYGNTWGCGNDDGTS